MRRYPSQEVIRASLLTVTNPPPNPGRSPSSCCPRPHNPTRGWTRRPSLPPPDGTPPARPWIAFHNHRRRHSALDDHSPSSTRRSLHTASLPLHEIRRSLVEGNATSQVFTGFFLHSIDIFLTRRTDILLSYPLTSSCRVMMEALAGRLEVRNGGPREALAAPGRPCRYAAPGNRRSVAAIVGGG
jgi:hypothetical protein